MDLPTGVLAYRMLKSANISEEKQQLVKVTLVALTYKDMKKKLKAIHNSVSNENDDGKIKIESSYWTKDDCANNESFYSNTNYRFRGMGYKSNIRGNKDRGKVYNSESRVDKWGRSQSSRQQRQSITMY